MLFSMIPLVKMSTKLTKPVIFVILIEGFLVKYTFLTRCNFHITKPKGIISTPNFPNAFPTPINCQWIIEAPFDTKVAVYFTQFYLKKGFTATEYSHYVREIRSGVGRLDFGAISASSEPTYLVSNQRILVLNMRVRNLDNIHLRVREHLIDVFGFNITYELIKKNESIREDLCINHHCSFTGYCLASSDFDNYSCGCFANHFGDECQYDDDCGPTATSGVCQNGGTCRYYIGSSIRTCECLPGYTGAKCEEATTNEKANGSVLAEMNCYETLYHTLSSYSITHPNFNCNEFDASLWRLEISDPMPIAEGVPLLIACIVVNDSSVNVVWLKDGYPINFKLTSGRVWNLTIPRDSYGRETYLLGFDRTHSLDTGTITCTSKTEKKDESLSVYITIKPLTKPLVTPLALTVRKGNSANITCVSKDDIEGDFLYTWRKNDSEISSRYDSEKAEDLFPVGTRIILRNVSASANYSCIVRSPTGSVRSSSTVTVVESKDFSSKTCKQNKSHGIRWKTTAAGMIDIHMCPNGYEGQVSRKCIVCSTRKVIWDKPDFSQCLSNELLEIKKEFDRRRMGFQSKSIHTVLMSLLHFLNTKSRDMRSSEGEPIVNILCSADFNMFFTDNFETNWHMLLEIFSLLFTNSLVLHTYERMKLMSAIQNITMLFADATQDQIWKIQNFENECLGINILKVSNNSFNLMEVPLQFHNQSESGMLQNVKLELLTKKNFTDIPASTVAFIVYKCLNLIEYEELIIRDKFMENSTVMTVFMSSAHFSEVKIRINFAHYYNINKIKNNISCWKLSLNERFLLKNECHIQEQRENYTICHCIGPGTFIIIQDYKTQEDHTELVYNDLTSLLCVGCFLAICIILHLFVKTLSSIKNKMQLLLA